MSVLNIVQVYIAFPLFKHFGKKCDREKFLCFHDLSYSLLYLPSVRSDRVNRIGNTSIIK
jgi:hypothetical protein